MNTQAKTIFLACIHCLCILGEDNANWWIAVAHRDTDPNHYPSVLVHAQQAVVVCRMRLLLTVTLALCASQALAQSKLSDVKKASEFSAACQPSASEVQKTYLSGFVMGVADASVGKHICPKEPISTQQLVDAFCGYLKQHPKNLNRPGGLLLGLALSEAWPCRQ